MVLSVREPSGSAFRIKTSNHPLRLRHVVKFHLGAQTLEKLTKIGKKRRGYGYHDQGYLILPHVYIYILHHPTSLTRRPSSPQASLTPSTWRWDPLKPMGSLREGAEAPRLTSRWVWVLKKRLAEGRAVRPARCCDVPKRHFVYKFG